MSKKARPFEMFEKSPTRHGGKRSHGKRKTFRPIATKKSMHLVLRASKANGTRSMLSRAHAERIRAVIDAAAAKNHVAVTQFANVGNHLHLPSAQEPARDLKISFVRSPPESRLS